MNDVDVRSEGFWIHLQPGALQEWQELHKAVWPELLATQGACGVQSMTVYAMTDELLFVHSLTVRPDAWERLIDTDVHRRWVAASSHLNASAKADDTVARELAPVVLHLDFDTSTA